MRDGYHVFVVARVRGLTWGIPLVHSVTATAAVRALRVGHTRAGLCSGYSVYTSGPSTTFSPVLV